MIFRKYLPLLCLVLGASAACTSELMVEAMEKPKQATASRDIDIWPKLNIEVKKSDAVESRIKSIMATMTLEQKIAQMIQPEIRDITVEDMRKYGFGSYLNGGGSFPDGNKQSTPQDWIKLAEDLYQTSVDDSIDGSTIPTMWGTDAVHGHNNVIGATLFPHNIGLGAANNPDLIEKIANATATEVMVTGIDWVFAPTVATVRDDRWGRTFESYSEDPEIVRDYAAAIVKGLQGSAGEGFLGDDRVISSIKHFVGDGGTVGGDDQGDVIVTEKELYEIHAQGYVGGLTAGAQSVMASFNSWHGDKVHGHKYLLTDVLKDKMGFDGFVVGDWNGHGQIKGCTNEDCAQAVNAGLDIYMVPTGAWKPLYENLIKQVNEGLIPIARIDDAVTRILRVKIRAGLFEKPSPANRQLSGKTELIGQQSHRAIAKQAVRESLVLLKNKGALLPLNPNAHILVAGDGADNIGKQSGGWTITWQGTNNTNDDFPGGTSIYDGIKQQVEQAKGSLELSDDGSYAKKPDVAIVVFGEDPYAEGHGDRLHVDYQRGKKTDLAMLKRLREQGIPVVSIFLSGRPMWVNQELNMSDAFVAAWLPGSEGSAVADVLFTDANGNRQTDFTGKLSFSWPNSPYDTVLNKGDEDYSPLLAYGYGLRYDDENTLSDDLSEAYEALDSESKASVIFTGTMQKPWVLSLSSGTTQTFVKAATATFGDVSYRTIDKDVQEDALRFTLNNAKAPSGVLIASKSYFREDMSNELINNSALSFMVKSDADITEPVLLIMSCESEGDALGSCRGTVNLTEKLNAIPKGTWQTVSVDLRCFAKQGVEFSKLVVPFHLVSTGNTSLDISDIQFKFDANDTATITCE